MKIKTFKSDESGRPTGVSNGYLVPIWSVLDAPSLRPDQIYVTAVAPYSRKGPHLHLRRRGMFCCVSGDVVIATQSVKVEVTEPVVSAVHHHPTCHCPLCRDDKGVQYPVTTTVPGRSRHVATGPVTLSVSSAAKDKYQRVVVEPGVACALFNPEGKETIVLNMPSPSWSKEEPDEYVVEEWVDPPHGKILAALEMTGT
jgi:hypothetical protein